MRLYFGGAEIGSHRRLLDEAGVQHVAMSYMGLRRRNKFTKPWLIQNEFPSYMSVFLDSGAYTVNANEDIETDEVEEIAEHYKDFVNANIDHVDMVSEFDAMVMGLDWIEEQRESFWNNVPVEKFMAIWHPVWGIPYLHEMASRYELIGIPATSLEGRELRPVLNALAAKGTRIHGVAMTKIEEMQSIRWNSVASNSWISPQRFGDTIVWAGNELKRYPKKYKERSRKQHRTTFRNLGIDADKIIADDPKEVLRLSITSWLKFEEYVNKHHRSGAVVTPLFSNRADPEVETPDNEVGNHQNLDDTEVPTPAEETGKSKQVVRRRDVDQILPVMGLGKAKEDDEDSPTVLNIRSESQRVCNTCFLADKCPGYEEDSNCVYNIPITVRTREQLKALRQGMLEIQAQRVLFMRMAEEMEGGYADPNLSNEIKTLDKMMTSYEEAEREGFSINISARGSSQQSEAGVMSRIFGRDAGQKVQELETPINGDDYIEAEIIRETEE